MIIPSIDLMNSTTVQLVGGREMKLDAGDPRPLAAKFGISGEIAVIDLDAAIGTGSNAALIRELLPLARCRVGGGIRDIDTAVRWLDDGASKVILGTAAKPEVLSALPRERVIAALDACNGEIVVKGWREGTGESILERMKRLNGLVSGYLITFVEREGRMQGTNLDQVAELVAAAGDARVTIAGGITTESDVRAIHDAGADSQVGMALYTGTLDFADAIAAPLRSDRSDGLFPTVIVDESGVALGLAYSSRESLRAAVRSGEGVYHSRSRGLWRKGETSGATQQLLRIDLDCDSDALRFTVRQRGDGFCHRSTRTCWSDAPGLGGIEERINRSDRTKGSYTKRLLDDMSLLNAKIIEEAHELIATTNPRETVNEAADVLYFTLVKLRQAGVSLKDVERELFRRTLRVTRRAGDAKKEFAT
jgi:phosphoribosyl-ATP pyrophosphohydrolase